MRTISAEQFRSTYGEDAVRRFSEIGSARGVQPSSGYTLKDAGGDVADTFLNMGKEALKAGEDILTRDIRKPNETFTERAVGYGADAMRGIGRVVSQPFIGAAKLAVPQSTEEAVVSKVGEWATKVGDTEEAKAIVAVYDALDPDTKTQVDNALGYLEGLSEVYTAGLGPKILKNIINSVRRGATATASTVGDVATAAVTTGTKAVTENAPGLLQTSKELLQRVPRAFQRGKEGLEDAAVRAEKISTATPAVRNALEVGLDERLINTATQADAPTRSAYKEMVDLAGSQPKTVGPKTQPSIVAGRAAEQTFDVLEKERRRIGQELGNEVKNLPKGTTVNMGPSLRQVEATLAENGIKVVDGKLSFKGKFTEAERTRVRELWNLVNEMGETMSPADVRNMDQTLSKLQREARMEGLGDLRVSVNGEDKSMFGLFRDIYSNQLENINPRIRDLNKQYRDAKLLVDELEDTIFKGGNYESIKGVDQAEFAKTNLRRIMGEAQSSPAYTELLSKMDSRARELGYTGARADELIYFAEELRKLFPDTIPKSGFQGGIRTGVTDLAERALQTGAPNTVDQQRALKALLDELMQEV